MFLFYFADLGKGVYQSTRSVSFPASLSVDFPGMDAGIGNGGVCLSSVTSVS